MCRLIFTRFHKGKIQVSNVTDILFMSSQTAQASEPLSVVGTSSIVTQQRPIPPTTSSTNDSIVTVDGGSNNKPSDNKTAARHVHSEDLLLRTWRSTAHSVAVVAGKAEKLVTVATTDRTNKVAQETALKELNDATIGFLRNHVEWGRSLSYIEAKLEGKAAEMESLQHYVRTHPSLGRKRKRLG